MGSFQFQDLIFWLLANPFEKKEGGKWHGRNMVIVFTHLSNPVLFSQPLLAVICLSFLNVNFCILLIVVTRNFMYDPHQCFVCQERRIWS